MTLRLAVACVRAWTRLYTCGLPSHIRASREAEIESDLWEFQSDLAGGRDAASHPSAQILLRLLIGMPDDLGWRMEQGAAIGTLTSKTVALSARTAGAVLFVLAMWVVDADVNRRRPDHAFRPSDVLVRRDIEPALMVATLGGDVRSRNSVPLLTAGIIATVGSSMMPALAAQSARSSAPAFEAASIKPNKSGSRLLGITPQSGGRFTATNVSVGLLIRIAYELPMFRMAGGPDWMESDRFDVIATAGYDAPQADLRRMVQTLLADRFHLEAHTESREQPIFELVLARRDGRLGPALRRTNADCAGADWPNPVSRAPRCGYIGADPDIAMSSGRSRFAVRGTSMEAFARFLQGAGRRHVVNRTGLDGYFDAEFEFTMEVPPPPPPPGIADPYDRADFPSIFTVLPEQLGLKLESARGPVEVLVIDSVEPPTPD